MSKAQELLADVETLRRRARRDRRASAFPLLLFGALILTAPLCYVPADPPPPGVPFTTYPGPFPLFNGVGFSGVRYPGLVSWYWFLVIVLGYVASAWWYRRRASRIGVETDTRAYLIAAGAALAGFLLGVPMLETLVPARDSSLYSTPSTNLPILIGSALAAAAALFWATRPGRGARTRAAALFLGVLLAVAAFSALGVYLIYGFAALLIIAVGLLALAWLERSVLLAGIGLAFGAAALLANLYNIENLFYRLGWTPPGIQLIVLQQVLLPAAVLLVGGAVVAVADR